MKNKNPKTITTTAAKLVFGGQALAEYEGKKIFIWNALPGEKVEATIYKNKSSYAEAIATKIISSSPHRIPPQEKHYLSCSPWQILTWEEEMRWKSEISRDIFERIGNHRLSQPLDIKGNKKNIYHYRNKMEYSFWFREVGEKDEELSLAFFERGKHRRIAIKPCLLGSHAINETAMDILKHLIAYKFPLRSLKSLIVRSNDEGETIAALFVKDRLS